MFDVKIKECDLPEWRKALFEAKPVYVAGAEYVVNNISPSDGNHYVADLSRAPDSPVTIRTHDNKNWLRKVSPKFLNHKGKRLASLYEQLDDIKDQIREVEEE